MANLNWKPFIYGGMASIVAEFGTFPIDCTKTRLQVQGQAQYMEVRYKGMFHALYRIGKEEGVKALYSGISPALLRQASYGTIKIGTYNTLKRLFVTNPEDETMVINVFCGVVSGVLSSSMANPTDVLKIRMQAQGSLLQGSMISNFVNIYKTEGTRGLWRVSRCSGSDRKTNAQEVKTKPQCLNPGRVWRHDVWSRGRSPSPQGVIPTAQRAAIVVGVELPVYDITKKHLISSGTMGDTILTHFISSFTCGLAGAVASNPVDVVRTRMMNQRALSGGPAYKGTLDGVMQTWKNEGFFALYKGFWPNWLRLGPWNIIFFITFEKLKQMPL
ncbi:brain mitochondrial carrier protein 1 isoform X2 [Gadus macrocephalus]|nr:brain mitochondrial carrier protein 1 isoform X2 [Gadus macrocephalus]